MKKTITLFALGIVFILLSFAVREVMIMTKGSNISESKYLIANVEALTQTDLDISFFWKAESIDIHIYSKDYPIAGTSRIKKITYKKTDCYGLNGDLECFPGIEIIREKEYDVRYSQN